MPLSGSTAGRTTDATEALRHTSFQLASIVPRAMPAMGSSICACKPQGNTLAWRLCRRASSRRAKMRARLRLCGGARMGWLSVGVG
jgi:hypothetical protein